MHDLHVIVGLGVTGLSCVRYLMQRQVPVAVLDTRLNPPGLVELKQEFPEITLSLGGWDEALLNQASVLVMSPGISLKEPAIAKQSARGISIIGDIELFALEASAPIIAITGTNAKSTVTTLVGLMAKAAGLNTGVGGNLGLPALDLLSLSAPHLFVLELSSFQLETTYSLKPQVATVLNVTPDHMDRYANLSAYAAVKRHIYSNCKVAVCNRDDSLTECGDQYNNQKLYFTLNDPHQNEFGLIKKSDEIYLAYEDQLLMPAAELPILGRHYQANALAALAIGHGAGLPMAAMLNTLKTFKGLPHRCQLIRELNGIYWYNDSKGTNVGATLAAIEGLGSEIKGKLILIAGGVGKNADFSLLVPAIDKYVKAVILIGEAAPLLATVIGEHAEIYFANDMEEAVILSAKAANSGDSILLSPACASLDMFRNFEHRGEVFSENVRAL